MKSSYGSGAFTGESVVDPSRMAALDVTAAEIAESYGAEYIGTAGSTRGPLVQQPLTRERTSKPKSR